MGFPREENAAKKVSFSNVYIVICYLKQATRIILEIRSRSRLHTQLKVNHRRKKIRIEKGEKKLKKTTVLSLNM